METLRCLPYLMSQCRLMMLWANLSSLNSSSLRFFDATSCCYPLFPLCLWTSLLPIHEYWCIQGFFPHMSLLFHIVGFLFPVFNTNLHLEPRFLSYTTTSKDSSASQASILESLMSTSHSNSSNLNYSSLFPYLLSSLKL